MSNTNEKKDEYPQVANLQTPNPPEFSTQGVYPAPPVGNIQMAYPQQLGFVLPGPPEVKVLQLPDFTRSQQYPPEANDAGYPKQEAGSDPGQTTGDNPPPYGAQTLENEEESQFKSFVFSEETIRKAFMRKVYSLLMCQLLVTVGFITFFVFHEPTKYWCRKNLWMLLAAMSVAFICICVMAFFEEVRRKYPMNLIFLCVFTLAKSFMLGIISTSYDGKEVLLAIGVTAAICLGLTIFAFQTKWDFTIIGATLICGLIVLVIIGSVAFYTAYHFQLRLWLAGLGVFIFSFYLIYDTQLMMYGEHKYSISPEEYIFAALNLYLDIINMFLRILILLARR